jgi:hypothetical protein
MCQRTFTQRGARLAHLARAGSQRDDNARGGRRLVATGFHDLTTNKHLAVGDRGRRHDADNRGLHQKHPAATLPLLQGACASIGASGLRVRV